MIKKVIAVLILTNVLFFGVVFQATAQTLTPCEQYCRDYNEYAKRSYTGTKPTEPEGTTCICNPLEVESFEELIEKIVDWLFNIAAIVAPVMIVLGAILFMTAGGKAERISTGKKVILWTIVGFLIILFSKGLINLVNYIIGVK